MQRRFASLLFFLAPSLSATYVAPFDHGTSCDPVTLGILCRTAPNLSSEAKLENLPLYCIQPSCYEYDSDKKNCFLYVPEKSCYYRWADGNTTPGPECPGSFS